MDELGAGHAERAEAKVELAVLRQQMGAAEEAMTLYREVIVVRSAELEVSDLAPALLAGRSAKCCARHAPFATRRLPFFCFHFALCF